jgi:hypothetical protein
MELRTDFFEKARCKACISVADDFVWDADVRESLVIIGFCYILHWFTFFAGNEEDCLCAIMVRDCENGVETP